MRCQGIALGFEIAGGNRVSNALKILKLEE